jgi:hypothetical protein
MYYITCSGAPAEKFENRYLRAPPVCRTNIQIARILAQILTGA